MLKAFNWELIAMEALNMSTLRRFYVFSFYWRTIVYVVT